LATLRGIADLEGTMQRAVQQLRQSEASMADLTARERVAGGELAETEIEVGRFDDELAELQAEIASLEKAIELARAAVDQQRRTLSRRRDEIAALKVRLQGVSERVSVLEDLRHRQEGVSGGVRSVLEMLRGGAGDGPLGDVLGIIADLFQSDVHAAPLIDAVLGEKSQYIAVRGGRFQQAVVQGDIQLGGRIGLIRVDELPPRRPGDRIRLDGLKGVIGRADRLVQTEKHLQPLAKHLLGTTWLVDSLATAFGLRRLSGAGLRFVTSRCELVEPDGSIVIGPAGAAAGLVSRRSELLAAQQERKHYRFQLRECEEEAERLAARLDQDEAELGRIEQQHRGRIVLRAACEANRRHAGERLEARQKSLVAISNELAQVQQRIGSLAEDRDRLAAELERRTDEAGELEDATTQCDRRVGEAREALQSVTSRLMSVSVEVARAEQKVEAMTATIEQQQRDQSQREAAVEEVRVQRRVDQARRDEIALRILSAGASLAELAVRDEQIERDLTELAKAAADIRAGGRASQKAYDAAVKGASDLAQQVHAVASRRDAALLKRQTLAERLLEDYEIDLNAEQPPENLQPIDDRDAIEQEVQHLRSQLQKTGSVNMEALEELQALQTRYDELHGQYQDLTAAKDSLQRIIVKINAESRRLFIDTLEAIRQNFQRLYRKSFGGGTADLILEDADDPLEAGVEIIATPPGKPSFNNSLLSGGEKALTAVALLMAIFQFRPSPFCVLDEVDAPFDEANIGRFVTVLNEFLDHTKFVVVTHSKKTMTAATTLYGVTMQESGISKQVSIRFEDVSEDGEISTDAA
jgi:chromosome segregation protein